MNKLPLTRSNLLMAVYHVCSISSSKPKIMISPWAAHRRRAGDERGLTVRQFSVMTSSRRSPAEGPCGHLRRAGCQHRQPDMTTSLLKLANEFNGCSRGCYGVPSPRHGHDGETAYSQLVVKRTNRSCWSGPCGCHGHRRGRAGNSITRLRWPQSRSKGRGPLSS